MTHPTLDDAVAAEVERLGAGAPVAAAVRDGVVTLTGAVQNEMRRIYIEQELLRLPGVLDVRNHLHVALPMGGLKLQLLDLLEREDIPAGGLDVAADDEAGAILLSGVAASWIDREAAERLAWTLPGVSRVTNRIVLAPRAAEPDADGEALP